MEEIIPTKTNKKIKSVKKIGDDVQNQNIIDTRERYSIGIPKQALKTEKPIHNRSTHIEIEDLD
jgi:hypothetical protein